MIFALIQGTLQGQKDISCSLIKITNWSSKKKTVTQSLTLSQSMKSGESSVGVQTDFVPPTYVQDVRALGPAYYVCCEVNNH